MTLWPQPEPVSELNINATAGINITYEGRGHSKRVVAIAAIRSMAIMRSGNGSFVPRAVIRRIGPLDRVIRPELGPPVTRVCRTNRIVQRVVGRVRAIRIFVLVFMHIHLQSHAHLPQMVLACGGAGLSLGPGERREQQCRENADDGDDHQQLGERERRAPGLVPCSHT